MTRREMIGSLENEAERIRFQAENRMTTLLDAARALQAIDAEETPGTDTPADDTATANGKPSITELVKKIFTESPNRVYDAAQVRGILLTADPDDAKRIKNGTYQAMTNLCKAKFIRRAPGGYELIPPQAPAPPP